MDNVNEVGSGEHRRKGSGGRERRTGLELLVCGELMVRLTGVGGVEGAVRQARDVARLLGDLLLDGVKVLCWDDLEASEDDVDYIQELRDL